MRSEVTGQPRLVWDVGADLGEGPVWVEHDRALWFTDIKRQKIYRFDPANGEKRAWDSPQQVGFVFPAASGGFVAGLESGLHHFDPDSGAFSLIAEVEPDLPTNRLNDGVVDPKGRLWFGTMDNSERAKSGAFYCFDRGELKRTGLSGISITNGPTISPDGDRLYWVDTLAGTISACDIGAGGELGTSREVVRIPPVEGHPDGPTVDSEGCIWISLYSGWEARRYSPDGELLDRVRFPVANITKLAFGGPDLRSAFATTARHLLKAEALERQPLAGGLFRFEADVAGVPCPLVAL
ncbi:MAG: xylono,5-lactonase [Sphingomonadales bacterium]|nr:xylono,5-lactonase [Sphingomonadales bacterium]